VLLASEDMITQRIDAHLARAKISLKNGFAENLKLPANKNFHNREQLFGLHARAINQQQIKFD